MIARPERRAVLAGALASGAGLALEAAGVAEARTRLVLTPGQTEGPYYPIDKLSDQDSDLVRVQGAAATAMGEETRLSGRVLNRWGRPVRGAVVEIWQCDSHGIYRHPKDPAAARYDNGFQGYGRSGADADGGYGFRTIKPGLYDGRTRHIHAAVIVPGHGRLVTQLYAQGEPGNEYDDILNSIDDDAQRASVILPYRKDPATGVLQISYDFVLRI